ncbi:hypothetical protein FQN49_002180 [Arthroderma sp. PD_2]|nr:hypothetical protein FQN49_002180 [Arthroderma sp. PD_2]
MYDDTRAFRISDQHLNSKLPMADLLAPEDRQLNATGAVKQSGIKKLNLGNKPEGGKSWDTKIVGASDLRAVHKCTNTERYLSTYYDYVDPVADLLEIMKLLIFGATGAVGGLTARKAIKHGHEITLHVRDKSRVPEDISSSDQVKAIFEGSLSDEPSLSAAIKGQDAILSSIGPKNIFGDYGRQFSDGYRLIVKLMHEHGVRRILAMSTISSYDERDEFAFMRSAAYWTVYLLGRRSQREILGIESVFKEDGEGLDWTLYRVGVLGNSKEDGRVANAGWVGDGRATIYLERRDWANWMIQEVEREEPMWVREMPVIYSPYPGIL